MQIASVDTKAGTAKAPDADVAELHAGEVEAHEPDGLLAELGHGQVAVLLQAVDVLRRGAVQGVELAVLETALRKVTVDCTFG